MYAPHAVRGGTTPVEYLGARVGGGPVERGVPLVAVQVAEDGVVTGRVNVPGSDPVYSLRWFEYCHLQRSPALRPDPGRSNAFVYAQNPAKMAVAERELGEPLWYAEKVGQPVRAWDFTSPGMGALAAWRSQGLQVELAIPVVVLRLEAERVVNPAPEGFVDQGLAAFAAACTHFCCTAGWKESAIPLRRGLFETIYCTCHDAVFDPYDVRRYRWPADEKSEPPVVHAGPQVR
jgi:nitrite reductase/ring-hydroxylating ferredoxin subunit